MMFFGMVMFFLPIMALFSWIPIIGGIFSFICVVIALLLTSGFSLITISVAWIYFRPILGIMMLMGGLAVLEMSKVIYFA